MEKELIDIDLSGVTPINIGEPKYNYRKMEQYCKKYNKSTEELTNDELKLFITGYITTTDINSKD